MMNFLERLKDSVPLGVKDVFRDIETPLVLRYETLKQMHRYERSYSRRTSREQRQLEPQIIFLVHQIEKGLSHTEFRPGFGIKVLRQLSTILQRFQILDSDFLHNKAYLMALGALKAYCKYNAESGFDLSSIKAIFPATIWQEVYEIGESESGTIIVKARDKQSNKKLPFVELMERRHSVREYSDKQVSVQQVEQAISIAMRSPSVCNRQPSRVHIITNQATCKELLKIQGGFAGYKTPPVLILVTADNSAFMNQKERNEGFVDGGIFSMSLLLSLEEEDIAACPLNTMMSSSDEEKTRKVLKLPDNEFLIMYIAIGHFPKEVRVPLSKRFLPSDIITLHN